MNRQLIISMLFVVSLFAVLPASVSADRYVSPGNNIQEAVDHAAANGGTVYFAPGTYDVNIVIDSPAKSFALKGAGAGVTTLDGNDSGSVIRIENTGESVVTVEGFTITNGVGEECLYYTTFLCGGGVYLYNATAIVNACVFTDNYAEDYGGGLYSIGSEAVVTNSTFHQNTADSYGGGMDLNYSSIVVDNCVFSENDSDYGGGLECYHTKATVTNCTFTENYAGDNGGGMYCCGTYSDIPTPSIPPEYATDGSAGKPKADVARDGQIDEEEATVVVSNCLFKENEAYYNGGGMMNCGASPVVTNCTFEDNLAVYNGGGMMNGGDGAATQVISCMFTGNRAAHGGGGMFNADETTPQVISCTFTHNWASDRGGGMHNAGSSYGAEPFVSGCVFSYNEAGWRGAGMDNHGYSAPVVTNCVFVANTVIGESADEGTDGKAEFITSAGGGGMFNGSYAEPVISNCTFTLNRVPYYSNPTCAEYDGENGGGVKFSTSYTSTVTNCIIWGNFCGENQNDVLDTYGDYALITYSNVGGGYPGEGNIDADPLFVNAPADVSLRAGSPCIDAGTNLVSWGSLGGVMDDILGVLRPQRSAYDMGAYECAGASFSPVIIQPLARTQLQSVLSLWEELLSRLPDEPTDEMAALIAQIQGHVANASQLTNPIYASGQLSKAAAAIQQLAALLA